jgi:hypothetical protein
LLCAFLLPALAETSAPTTGHYLFAWTGDADKKGNDFLAVIDADTASAAYGQLVTTVATDQQTVRIHHTEYVMPASGMLFANDHDVGRTFIFDVNDPLRPLIVKSFTDMDGYMHPHSFVRLPNGHVLATFQHTHRGRMAGQMGVSGGLVEIDDNGNVIRSASNADPAFADALLMPYGLVVLPEEDRVVSTNSSMHNDDVFSGVTYQIWRLSDLKLLKTAKLYIGPNGYAQISPEEPRRGRLNFRADLGLWNGADYGCDGQRAFFQARAYLSGQLVRGSNDRRALFRRKRSCYWRPDCHGYRKARTPG